ncbi:MAG: MaoC family dehydratase N-terminal domain-containing protein [Actinobacteria bacterium]|nr:MaoC family dehydratase N-terminal domain-containing protein [Actinomycetota bacterium]
MSSAGVGFERIAVGHEFQTSRRTVTEADITHFSAITGDYSPLHADQVFVEEETDFRTRIAQGWLIVAIQSGLHCEIVDWRILAFLSTGRRFVAPVYPGDTIHAEYRVEEVRPSSSKPDRGVVTLSCTIVNQDGVAVVTGTETFLVERGTDG